MVIAHRGDSGSCPENTMAAFRSATQLGTDMIEFDVQPTRDMELVVLHDEKVDRTTDGCGRAGDHTLGELRGLDAGSWFDPGFRGERVPTLEEVLREIPERVEVNIELKRFRDTPPYEEIFIDAFRRHGLHGRGYVATRDTDVAREVGGAEPGTRRILIQGPRSEEECISEAVDLDVDVIQIRRSSLSRGFVEEIHDHGFLVFLFYADSPGEMQSSVDMGVDGVLTNWPGRLVGLPGTGESKRGPD